MKIRVLTLLLLVCQFCKGQQETAAGNLVMAQWNADRTQAGDDSSFTRHPREMKVSGTIVTPVFTTPDTVCVNSPVNIINTTVGASSYYWNFCVAGINSTPSALNLGNPGGYLAEPVFSDIVEDNGNYYAFIVNHVPGGLVRLDFGNSLLNIPVPFFLGNPSGAMSPDHGGNEGIQVVKNEGKWYAIIVGGFPPNGSIPRIVKIEFGANIANNSPTGTNWGNLGALYEPIDLHMFQENDIWYGFTVNAESNTITRFNFTNSFDNTPTAVNLGNIGNLNYPTGIYAINDNGNWRIFIGNGRFPFSITRLDFGNSLLNTPTGTNLGNPGNALNSPRDFTILRLCDEIAGFAVNGTSNDIAKFNFHNDLSSIPSGISLGNTGNLNFPHSLSKFFRVGNDLYTLITNVNNNTITRIQFTGCTSSSISSSTLQTPAAITYNTPGTYNINLSVDEGLATQNSYCRQVVVIPALVHTPLKTVTSCTDSIKIGAGVKQASYLWNTGATTDSIYVKGAGVYWVNTSRFGCSNTDSFTVAVAPIAVKANNDTAVCSLSPVQLNAYGAAAIAYRWSPATGLSNPVIANPLAKPALATEYIVTATASNGCTGKDTVLISVKPAPVIVKTKDTTICHDKSIRLNVSGGNAYTWVPSATLNNINAPDPVAMPVANTTYHVTVTNNSNCSISDSIKVSVKLAPVFSVSPDTATCWGTAVQLAASGGNVYSWQPADGLDNTGIANPLAMPLASTLYTVKIKETTCSDSASLVTRLTVLPLPEVQAASSNNIDCTQPTTQLTASGALKYLWQPAAALNDSAIAKPLASPGLSTLYTVKGMDANGCSNDDTVSVVVTHSGDLLVNMANAFSPNGDGHNDCFGVSRYAGLLQHLELSVYDRFGVRIFYTTNAQNCWDGRYKGTLQDAGAFVYILKARTFCGDIFKKGIIMLLK